MSETESGQAAESKPHEATNQVNNSHANGRPSSTSAAIVSAAFAIIACIVSGLSYLNSSDQTKISHDALVIAQRAFVGLDSSEEAVMSRDAIVRTPGGLNTEIFAPHIVNYGKTPAYSVSVRMYSDFTQDGVPDKIFDKIKSQNPLKFTINPTGYISSQIVNVPTGGAARSAIENQGYNLFIIGNIRYKDVFSAKHLTQFCFIIDKDTLSRNPTPLLMESMKHCVTHNCSDDDCKPQ